MRSMKSAPRDRLRRFGEQTERFGKVTGQSLENLIVIGASGGVIKRSRKCLEDSRMIFPRP